MQIIVTQETIDKANQNQTYWLLHIGTHINLGTHDHQHPIITATQKATGRQTKLDYWPTLRLGILTRCSGGFYMYDLPQNVKNAGHLYYGQFILDYPVTFEIPIETEIAREEQYIRQREEELFAYAI